VTSVIKGTWKRWDSSIDRVAQTELVPASGELLRRLDQVPGKY
jgi:hypothetical protein